MTKESPLVVGCEDSGVGRIEGRIPFKREFLLCRSLTLAKDGMAGSALFSDL